MSRRSLRLNDNLLDRSLPHSSASFSVGGAAGIWRNNRYLKSHRSQQLSVSCSDSVLVHTPSKLSGQLLHNSSIHSVASDASLLSSLLDESSIQESTLVDTLWGLDHDNDPKESTVIAEQSTIVADITLTGSDFTCTKQSAQVLGRDYCKDGEPASVCCGASKRTLLSSKHEEPETPIIYCRGQNRKRTVRSHHYGVMSVGEATENIKELHSSCSPVKHTVLLTPPGGDSKEKQCNVMDAVSSSSSSSSLWTSVQGMMWRVSVFTASRVFALAQSTAANIWPLIKKSVGASWCTGLSAGKTAGEAFRCLRRRWHFTNASALLSRFPLLVLLPLLVFLCSLCWFGPAGIWSLLPPVNHTEWMTALYHVSGLSSIYSFSSSPTQSADGAVESGELQPNQDLSRNQPPIEAPITDQEAQSETEESTRLLYLEQSLATLWEKVEDGGQQAEQRHQELLHLYTNLQQQHLSSVHSDSENMKPWLSALLDQQLSQLRTRLDEEGRQREQTRQQDLLQQQSHTSRLDQLELQLKKLAANTEKMKWRQEASATFPPSQTTLPVPVSMDADQQSHDALLVEVARLEQALDDVRQDLKSLSSVQNSCQQLDRIHQTVSSQVREEVRSLVYGKQLMVGAGPSKDVAGLPESLLQWLSQQYVTGSDLQAALASLELSILQNISLQLQEHYNEEMVRHVVRDSAGAPGAPLTQEDVNMIVKNALQQFSQDRTGLADYALESGGGSILSTRCSETYETKAALLSLFGVPLWYFSQSPRAVIQPDVHPGNCWAFRGSTGFLVIRLSMRILPTAFSLEHIPKALTPSGTLLSAPRDFSVYGLEDEIQETGKLLGTYTYDEAGEALQTYAVTEDNDQAFQIIEVQVLSNWGHDEYTCMYRFRVHGTPSAA